MIDIRDAIRKSDDDIYRLTDRKLIKVGFDDGVIEMTPGELMIDAIILRNTVTIIPSISIKKRYSIVHNYVNNMFSSATLNTVLSNIRVDVCKYIFNNLDKVEGDIIGDVDRGIIEVINELYIKVSIDSYSDIITLDISDIYAIYKDPDIREAMIGVEKRHDPASIAEVYSTIDRVIADKFTDNNLGLAYLGKAAKDKQVQHIVGVRGFVQDLDSKIYKYPIPYGYLEGLKDIVSFLVESKTAAIALYHSTSSITDSEWFARESQIKAQSVRKLIHTDCGTSTNLLEMTVNKVNKKDFTGCLYKESIDDLEYILLEEDSKVEGKTIHIRHAGSCELDNHDEVCLRCFGIMGVGIRPLTNLGAYCSVSITESKTQGMLGFKHLNASAVATVPVLETMTNKYLNFVKKDEAIKVRTKFIHAKGNNTLHVEIPLDRIKVIGTPTDIDTIDTTYIKKMSDFKELVFCYVDDNGNESEKVVTNILKDNSSVSFSVEFIKYILEEERYTIRPNNTIRISLEGWQKYSSVDMIIPSVVGAGATRVLEDFKNIIKQCTVGKEKTKLLDINSAIQRLYSHIGPGDHLSLLSVLLYSTTIDSNNKFKLARADSNRVCHTFRECFEYASFSAVIGYGYFTTYMRKPNLLSDKREDHPLDVLITPTILNK